jgi:hypothetical protein
MPERDGFEVLRARGTERIPAVICVTAHDEFAVRAFEAHALDYLLKPLNVERFQAALGRVRERLRTVDAVERAARLKALLAAERAHRQKRGIERLVVSTPSGELVIPVAEIDWIGGRLLFLPPLRRVWLSAARIPLVARDSAGPPPFRSCPPVGDCPVGSCAPAANKLP